MGTAIRSLVFAWLPSLRWYGCVRHGHQMLTMTDGAACMRCGSTWSAPTQSDWHRFAPAFDRAAASADRAAAATQRVADMYPWP